MADLNTKLNELAESLKTESYKFLGCDTIRTCASLRIASDAGCPRIRGIVTTARHVLFTDFENKKVKVLNLNWRHDQPLGCVSGDPKELVFFDCGPCGLTLLDGTGYLATTNGMNRLMVCDLTSNKVLQNVDFETGLTSPTYAFMFEFRNGILCVAFSMQSIVHLFEKRARGNYFVASGGGRTMESAIISASYSRALDCLAVLYDDKLVLMDSQWQVVRTIIPTVYNINAAGCSLTDIGLLTLEDSDTNEVYALTPDGKACQKLSHRRYGLYDSFVVVGTPRPDVLHLVYVETFNNDHTARKVWTLDEAIWSRSPSDATLTNHCSAQCDRPDMRYFEADINGVKKWFYVEMTDEQSDHVDQLLEANTPFEMSDVGTVVDSGNVEQLPTDVDRERRANRKRRKFHDLVLRE